MVNKVSEKHSPPIFWAETKFNNVQSLLTCTQNQQVSPTSITVSEQEVISVSTIAKP
jgi:hypothetical protein